MEQISEKTPKSAFKLLLTVFAVIIIITVLAIGAFYIGMKAETYIRYAGIKSVASEKIAKTAWGMEMNAKNVFDEVDSHLDSPEHVIEALESKTSLNPEVRGYFAAFVPNFFPEKGTWFEPYVHQTDSFGEFEVTLVGSARHDYTKSDWYVRAMRTHDSFWSDPYYYYDGTNISGHYCTFVKPIFDERDRLVCVCGADMTFEWLTKDIAQIDARIKADQQLYQHSLGRNLDFYTVVLNRDGSCIAHPEGKRLSVNDERVIKDLEHDMSGTVDMDVNGEPCTVYYGPIDHVDWSVAVVVPRNDVWRSVMLVGAGLLVAAVIGMLVVWLVYRKVEG